MSLHRSGSDRRSGDVLDLADDCILGPSLQTNVNATSGSCKEMSKPGVRGLMPHRRCRTIARRETSYTYLPSEDIRVNRRDDASRILLIDDDLKLGEMLTDYLRPDRLEVTVSGSGEDGLARLDRSEFDLVILDIMLPGMSGLDVLRTLRGNSNVPVIMLTARGDDVDRIIGLEIGADDYLPKPFNPRELTARIKAILRRVDGHGIDAEPERREVGGLTLEAKMRRASVGDRALSLTGTEFEILRCLMEKPGQVVSKEQLSQRALGRRLLPFDRSIDTHISNLRQKLAPATNVSITNQRGVGYLMLVED